MKKRKISKTLKLNFLLNYYQLNHDEVAYYTVLNTNVKNIRQKCDIFVMESTETVIHFVLICQIFYSLQFPSGYYGHFRSKSRNDFVNEYRQQAKPSPPEKFTRKLTVRI